MAFDIGGFLQTLSSIAPLISGIQDYNSGQANAKMNTEMNDLNKQLLNAQINNQNIMSNMNNNRMMNDATNNMFDPKLRQQNLQNYFSSRIGKFGR